MNVVEKMKLRIFFLKMRDFELICKKKLCSPFEAFRWNISLSAILLFLRSDVCADTDFREVQKARQQ